MKTGQLILNVKVIGTLPKNIWWEPVFRIKGCDHKGKFRKRIKYPQGFYLDKLHCSQCGPIH